VVSIVMMMVILVSTLAFIAESETLPSGALATVADDANAAFLAIEYVCVIIFTIDYVVRICSCPKVKAFLLNIMNAIDLAAILPFWIFLLPLGMDGGSFAFVRVIRLIRVFRVFKLGRYSVGLQMFAGAMSSSLQPLGILVFVMSINMIIVSSIVHLFEVASVEEAPYPDYCFCTISNTFWWAVVTMTTVGYGDCYPITSGGKTVAVITMLSGVLILALPITVIGSNFAKMVEMFEEDNAAYTLTDGDGDGLVDEFELREFIVRKKKEGSLQKNVDTKVASLMAKYDPQGNGTLSKQEFTALQRDIINPSANDPFADIHEMSEKVAANAENFLDVHNMIEARLGAVEFLLQGIGKQMGMPAAATDALNHPKTPGPRKPGAAPPAESPPGAGTAAAADGTATDGSEPGPSLAPSPPPPAHHYDSLPVPASIYLPASALDPAALRGETSGGAGSSQPHPPFALSAARPVAPRAGAVQLQPLGAGSGALPPPPRPLPPTLDQSSDS
jgi:hypothetical protein